MRKYIHGSLPNKILYFVALMLAMLSMILYANVSDAPKLNYVAIGV